MNKYEALKDFYSASLGRGVNKGEVIELDYTAAEIKDKFGTEYVKEVATKTSRKQTKKVNVEEGE